jgi:hypothetical protein
MATRQNKYKTHAPDTGNPTTQLIQSKHNEKGKDIYNDQNRIHYDTANTYNQNNKTNNKTKQKYIQSNHQNQQPNTFNTHHHDRWKRGTGSYRILKVATYPLGNCKVLCMLRDEYVCCASNEPFHSPYHETPREHSSVYFFILSSGSPYFFTYTGTCSHGSDRDPINIRFNGINGVLSREREESFTMSTSSAAL